MPVTGDDIVGGVDSDHFSANLSSQVFVFFPVHVAGATEIQQLIANVNHLSQILRTLGENWVKLGSFIGTL